jgi:hypothetical protein
MVMRPLCKVHIHSTFLPASLPTPERCMAVCRTAK